MVTKLTLANAKKELTKLNVKFDKNADLKTLTDLLSKSIDAEEVEAPENTDEIDEAVTGDETSEKDKGKGKTKPEKDKGLKKEELKTVVIESSFYDGNVIYRTGKKVDVTKIFFKKYEKYFKKDAKKVKLEKID